MLEQRQWNRWDLVARVGGMDEARMDTCPSSGVVFDLALCHTLRNLEKRSGVPEEPARSAGADDERASGGRRRTPMRKKIHPRCHSSPSHHQSRMWAIVVWCVQHGVDIDGDGMRGIGWDEWPVGGCAVQRYRSLSGKAPNRGRRGIPVPHGQYRAFRTLRSTRPNRYSSVRYR